MLTRTLVTLTLLLAFNAGAAAPAPEAGTHLDRARAARHARDWCDDVEGCRESRRRPPSRSRRPPAATRAQP